jgi:sensor histidine kinase YesM
MDAQKNEESGIGLHNVRKRLKLQYHEKHKLSITENSNTYNIHLEITDR